MTGFRRYTHGDCTLLAVAVSDLTGWPVVEMQAGDPPQQEGFNVLVPGYHALVELPDGRLLDGCGLHDYADFPTGASWLRRPSAAWDGHRTAVTPEVVADARELLRITGLASR